MSSSSHLSHVRKPWPKECFLKPGTIVTDAFSLAPQKVFYKTISFLGKGAFSECYRMLNKHNNQYVAVKVLPHEKFQKDEEKKKEFKFSFSNIHSEVRTMLQCKEYAGILQLHTFFNDGKYVYAVMELCTGGTLSQYIYSFPAGIVPCVQRQAITRQIAHSLFYLHDTQKIVHRDLKSDNLFFLDEKQTILKLADFGFSETFWDPKLKQECFLTEAMGTPTHTAPELTKSPIQYKASVDIWAFGVVLYQMSYGKLPFFAPTLQLILEKVRNAKSELVYDNTIAGEETNDLLKHMLEPDVEKRWTIVQILEHPFLQSNTSSISISDSST